MNEISIHNSSGNVFADLGIQDSEESLTQSALSAQILKIIQRRHLTQAAAGKLLGISQAKVSALLNGRLEGFSTERLFRFLNRLGCDVQIKVSKSRGHAAGHVRVLAG